jgi:hypothetical protein
LDGRVGLIDAVVADAVLRRKQAGQDRRVRRQRQRHALRAAVNRTATRPADRARGDADAEPIGAPGVDRDQQDVRPRRLGGRPRQDADRIATMAATASNRSAEASRSIRRG